MQKDKVYSVNELNSLVKGYLKDSAPWGLWVKGEILDLKINHAKRYASFHLCEKDSGSNNILSQVRVVCWGGELSLIESKLHSVERGLRLKDGLFVQILATLDMWPKAGQFQIVVKDIEPAVTIGEIHLTRANIYNALKEKGIHEKNKEKEIPALPLKIGLVAAKESAGFKDFVEELRLSKFPFEIYFYQASVQGEKIEKDIVKALKFFAKKKEELDLVAIVRGGGSSADLKWFDNQKIAEAIALFPLPVFTGIGHEINLSVVDMVACQNFKTPTAVASFIVENVRNFSMSVDYLTESVCTVSKEILSKNRATISTSLSEFIATAKQAILIAKKDVEQLSADVPALFKKLITQEESKIENINDKVKILSPENVLKLGYSFLKDSKGKIVKSVKSFSVGDKFSAVMHDGTISGDITSKEEKKV